MSILLEEIRNQNRAVLEAVSDMARKVKQLDYMREDIAELKSDMRTVKAVLTDSSRAQLDHERRITRLEANQAH